MDLSDSEIIGQQMLRVKEPVQREKLQIAACLWVSGKAE